MDIKPDKYSVIEIEDVDYLLSDKAVAAIEYGKDLIPLMQLYDGQTYLIALKTIEESLKKTGVTDYLDKS